MATSGTATFTATRNQLIEGALRLLVVIKAGETVSAQLLNDGARRLNGMVKRWQGKGLHVWTVTEATLFPQADQVRYALGLSSTDHATQSYVATELDVAAASGDTVLTVDSIDDISASDHVGVVLDDGTIHWTTISGAPSSGTITLATALTGAAASGNKVFAYTTKIVRPLKITSARRYNIASGNESTLLLIARLDYQNLPNKTRSGTSNQFFYDPQLTTGYLNLWLGQSRVTDLVTFTWWRPIEDFNAAGDNPDLPQEWIDAIEYNLAMQWAPEFSVPTERFNQIAALAKDFLDDASGFDREAESIEFGIEMAN